MSLKCFSIDCDGDYGAQLYFAATTGKAKMQACSEEDCRIVDVVSCKRKPEYDQYAPGPVPRNVLMDDGWWFECSGCNRQVWGEDEDDDGNVLIPVFDGEYVWCSDICRAQEQVRETRRKQGEAEMQLRVRIAVSNKFPGLTVGHAWQPYRRSSPMCQLKLGDLHIADWEIDSPFISIAPVNLPAWNEYEDRRFADRPIQTRENEGGVAA